MKKYLFLIIFNLLSFGTLFSQDPEVWSLENNTDDITTIIQNTFQGSGLTITNVNYTGGDYSFGNFYHFDGALEFADGIILSTGDAREAAGLGCDEGPCSNTGNSGLATTSNSGGSDSDLMHLGGTSINDASVLEIEFIPSNDYIQLRYSFASEEYQQFTCSTFNDGMGIFLSGPGIFGEFENDATNIGFIPGTDIPVGINSVNSGVPSSGSSESFCTSLDYSALFVDNISAGHPLEYNGYTLPFVAGASVVPGETYKIKIAIGDGGDTSYDSALFLEWGSFETVAGHTITGNLFMDIDSDCQMGMDDLSLEYKVVEAQGNNGVYYTSTDTLGYYSMVVDDDLYQMIPHTNNPYLGLNCPGSYTADFTSTIGAINVDLPIEPIAFCPHLEVDVSALGLRECFENNYHIQYCNSGTLIAEDAYVELVIDPLMTISNSSIAFTGPTNNVYTFDIGDVEIGDCGNFTIGVELPCDTLNAGQFLGQTLCLKAHIYPDSLCFPPTPSTWDGSSTIVESYCDQDSVYFKIINGGNGDMSTPRTYYVIEDQVMFIQDTYQLLSQEEITLAFEANGSTFRLEADQAEDHPGDSNPSTAIEACGTITPFSLGYINQFPQDEANPFISIECIEVTASYDPNDKQGFPVGYDDQHFIERGQDIEYLIRFQNTGNDVAFKVVLEDIIDESLDITSINLGVSSHPYDFKLENRKMVFTFDDINLVDSTTNEAESHGFVKFTIQQMPDLSLGTIIENTVDIFFDFNAAITTNTTFHTIGEDFIEVNLINDVADAYNIKGIKAYPNPFTEYMNLEIEGLNESVDLVLYDITGKIIRTEIIKTSPYQVMRDNLNEGIYFYDLLINGERLASGKMMIK